MLFKKSAPILRPSGSESALGGFAENRAHYERREIPYNYTSWTDEAIVRRLLGDASWQMLEQLRTDRVTGRSARMLFEVLGDIWAVRRNPYLEDDLIDSPQRRQMLRDGISERIREIRKRANNNDKVLALVSAAEKEAQRFSQWFDDTIALRRSLHKKLSSITHPDNIAWDALSRVSHVTDATDWRVEYPFVVLLPDRIEEIAPLTLALKSLGMTIIPRGGGTGYTGSVIPLESHSAVMNCEKLEKINPIEWIVLPSATPNPLAEKAPTILVESGVVTKRVMEAAEAQGLVFAVDPTSADASCIGGNIAMNAGGKKAVLWGTALDNLISWTMVNAQGQIMEITRLDHHRGKIHDVDQANFLIETRTAKGESINTETLAIPGATFRKAGLGKDVTDKFLSGLPGVQKEGCDGFILSARFLLHQLPSFVRTFCVEFYGRVDRAIGSIVAIKDYMDQNPEGVVLAGLEHLDGRYLRAVGYTSKAARSHLPRMVLIGDLACDDEAALNRVVSAVIHLAQTCGIAGAIEGFVATTAEEKTRFWADRGRTAAIAKHTNAFKINEDVVIPLAKMGEYSDGIEHLNVQLSLENKLALCQALQEFFTEGQLPTQKGEQEFSAEWIAERAQMAKALVEKTARKWQFIQAHLESPINILADELKANGIELVANAEYDVAEGMREGDSLFRAIQYGGLRISWKQELWRALQPMFQGQAFIPTLHKIREIHREVLKGRLFVALHMHAGDGNVHTNIPVNSDNATMLARAHRAVADIMALARRLGGVISGEHGIGLTKIEYLSEEELSPFRAYKQRVDPDGVFNRRKLMHRDGLRQAYTPSFSLIGHESLVLETTELGRIANDIKNCLRCGKCKPVCATHVPRANILYSPRNKILGTSLMIEAILYSAQTRRGISPFHVSAFADLADHCTICHKCVSPCPVDIDFGDVTISIRQYLKNQHRRRTNLMTWFAIRFLSTTDPRIVRFMRLLMINIGYPIQNGAVRLGRYLALTRSGRKHPRNTTHIGHKPPIREQIVQFMNRPLPSHMPMKTARQLLDINYPNQIPIIRSASKIAALNQTNQPIESVFYFPGCGSERLFSQVSLATQALLYDLGVQCVLPPTYLCCGYPQLAAGYSMQADSITTLNRVLFHRIANALNYLDIKTVIVSCGTCIDQLEKYQFAQIFQGCRLMDIHEYLMEKGVALLGQDDSQKGKYLYHDPCHSPIKIYKAGAVVSKVMGESVPITARCCGESGTLAVTRPDVANQVRFSKSENIRQNVRAVKEKNQNADRPTEKIKILTSCPSCLQGLARYRNEAPITADYVVVELARRKLGESWLTQFVAEANREGVERVIF